MHQSQSIVAGDETIGHTDSPVIFTLSSWNVCCALVSLSTQLNPPKVDIRAIASFQVVFPRNRDTGVPSPTVQ